jgi:hypothetical protein
MVGVSLMRGAGFALAAAALACVPAIPLLAAPAAPPPADAAVAARDAGWLAAFRRSREALCWTDLAVRHDWRVQRHSADGRCRILDPADGTIRDMERSTAALGEARMRSVADRYGARIAIVPLDSPGLSELPFERLHANDRYAVLQLAQ